MAPALVYHPQRDGCAVPRLPVLSAVGALLWAALGGALGVPIGAYVARAPDCRPADLLRQDGNRWVPLATAALFGVAWFQLGPGSGHPPTHLPLASLYILFLVAMFVIDWQHRLILDSVSYPAIAVAAGAGWLWRWPEAPDHVLRAVLLSWLGGALAFLVFFLFWLVGTLLHPDAFGLGDVKLAAFIGFATGLPSGYPPPPGPNVLSAIFLGSIIGAVMALAAWLARRKGLREPIPYGPALIGGMLVVMLW